MNTTQLPSGAWLTIDEPSCGWTTFHVSRDGQKPVRFAGRPGKATCGAKCRNSAGPSCTCSCGGHNHGRDRW